MSIELKRNLLRISREKLRNPNFQFNPVTGRTQDEHKEDNNLQIKQPFPAKLNRIKTSVKSEYLGKNLNPDYIGKFKDKTFIVAGCGSSLNNFTDFSKYYIIGVNDIERILTPDFLVVVNDYRTFSRGRWDFVKETLSPVIFTHLDNPGPITRSSNIAKLKIGKKGIPNLDQFNSVDHTLNSPYMAVIIAYQLGAKKIGMVGVDFSENHFFNETGTHKLSKHLKSIDQEYGILKSELEKKGVKVANLSPISLLTSWPKMDLETFDAL